MASFVQTKTQTNNNQIEKIFNQWQSDAVIIYDNFISLQAKSSLGFDLLIRQQVETNICLNIIDHLDIEYLVNSYSNVFCHRISRPTKARPIRFQFERKHL